MSKQLSRPEKRANGSWRIRWTDKSGVRKSAHYKDFKEAKKALAFYELKKNKNFREYTFQELSLYYQEHRLQMLKNKVSVQSIINKHLAPFFDQGLLSNFQVQVDMFQSHLNEKDISKKTQLNILSTLGAMLTVALRLGWIDSKPYIQKPRHSIYDRVYTFLETKDEISMLLDGAKKTNSFVAPMLYQTAIYTGMRAGELAGLTRDKIDLENRLITVSKAYEDSEVKNSKARRIPIVDALHRDLIEWLELNSLNIVFPNGHGNYLKRCNRIFQEVLHKSLREAGLHQKYREQKEKPLTFHDLRHTFASHWMMNGGDIYTLKNVLGHSDLKMTQRYAHLDPNQFSKTHNLFN